MNACRPPAVAGMFYPDNPGELAATVDGLLQNATPPDSGQPKALIVPHAGYAYSGPTAAQAYAAIRPWRSQIRRVVLLGPTHRVAVNGLALPEAERWATPLGDLRLDSDSLTRLQGLPQIVRSDLVHAREHSLEVHLPFLQRLLDDFTLVPLAVGHASPEAVAEVLDLLWGGPETLIVISSDLSHFLDYSQANRVDGATCHRILDLTADIRPEQACGAYPVNGLLLVARRRGLIPTLIQRCNSGDTAGDRQRVVGYAAFAFHETASHG